MTRKHNTNRRGNSWTKKEVLEVWNKAILIPGQDSSKIRKDSCGASIHFDKHGDTVLYGWEIDHIKPVAKGGKDEINNLQALKWQNNRSKSDDYPAINFCVHKA